MKRIECKKATPAKERRRPAAHATGTTQVQCVACENFFRWRASAKADGARRSGGLVMCEDCRKLRDAKTTTTNSNDAKGGL